MTRRATGKSSRGGNGGSDASADGGSADDDDGDGDDGPKFDVGSGMTGGDDGGSPTGCEKIDFLFVMLGLFSLLSDQSCIGFGPQEATKFVEFVQLFGARGLMGSVCEPDYNAFFQMAVDQIDKSCDEYVPPAG